jgi:hypothetical protein
LISKKEKENLRGALLFFVIALLQILNKVEGSRKKKKKTAPEARK